MRVVEFRALSTAAPAGMLTCLDGFAALHGVMATDPAIGGFRIVHPRRTRSAAAWTRALHRLTAPRLHVSSSLAVLFTAGLAAAVLAGPASCPCAPETGDTIELTRSGDATALARFAYMRASAVEVASAERAESLPQLVALAEPASTMEFSSISTSALPTPDTRPEQAVVHEPAHLGLAPPSVETIAAAPPRIRLAAAAPEAGELAPLLPMVEIVTPNDEPEALNVEPTPQFAPETAHPASVAAEIEPQKARSKRTHRTRKSRARKAAPPSKVARAPRWAQQMFDNPWQSSAFSYVR